MNNQPDQSISSDIMQHTPRRILCYSPYNSWAIHGMWEMTILQAIKLRGADVQYVLCDGLYSDCDVFWKAMNPRHALACTYCQASVANLTKSMGMMFEWLGRYVMPDDFQKARRWAAELDVRELMTATHNGWDIGKWVEASVHTHLRLTHLDFTLSEVEKGFRSYLYSGLIACLALTRLLDHYHPDLLFLFSGRMSSTRIAFELARRRGVRVICHERGLLDENLYLSENISTASLSGIKQAYKGWSNIPLQCSEIESIHQYLEARQYGKGLNWRAFSPLPQDIDVLCKKLGLNLNRPIWALYSSSDDEVIAEHDWRGAFERQTEWIERTISYVGNHPQIDLVIRVHPNTAGKKATGNNLTLLQDFQKLQNSLPPNVKIVMPDDEISSYSLMDIATLGLVYHSTVGLEMACKGKHIIVAASSFVSDMSFVQTVKAVETYEKMLDRMSELPLMAVSDEIKRMAYRFAYTMFFRCNIPFPLVKMPTPYTGKLNYTSLNELLPGREPNLDRIARIILENEPVCPPPAAEDRLRTEDDEIEWFKNRSQRNNGGMQGIAVNRQVGSDDGNMADRKRTVNPIKPKELTGFVKNIDSAEDRYAKANELNKQGVDFLSKKDVNSALNAFTKAVELNPNFAGVHNNLGILYWQTGKVQEAQTHFAKALEIDPNDRNTILNCGELLKFYKRIEDAKAIYSSYLQRNPGDNVISKALGDLDHNF